MCATLPAVMKRFLFSALIVLVSLGAVPASAGQITAGIVNTFIPERGETPHNDLQGFVYVPFGAAQGSLTVTRRDRGDYTQHIGELGAVWVWGGPFYSEARVGLGTDTDGVTTQHGYFDLFYERSDWYATGFVRGSNAPGATERWDYLTSLGVAWYGYPGLQIVQRLYHGGAADGERSFSAATRGEYDITSRIVALGGGSIGVRFEDRFDADSAGLRGALNVGAGYRLGERWRAEYRFEQGFPVAEARNSLHTVALVGRFRLER